MLLSSPTPPPTRVEARWHMTQCSQFLLAHTLLNTRALFPWEFGQTSLSLGVSHLPSCGLSWTKFNIPSIVYRDINDHYHPTLSVYKEKHNQKYTETLRSLHINPSIPVLNTEVVYSFFSSSVCVHNGVPMGASSLSSSPVLSPIHRLSLFIS